MKQGVFSIIDYLLMWVAPAFLTSSQAVRAGKYKKRKICGRDYTSF